MALRAWMDGDIRLALRLLQWANPKKENKVKIFDEKLIEFKAA